MLSKLLKLLILAVILSSCAKNMDKQNKDKSSKLPSEMEDKTNKSTSKEENEKDYSKLGIDKTELKIPKLKTIQFGDKSTEEIISFFEKYKVKFFENDRKVDGFIENQDGNLVSIDKFDEDKFPSEPSLAWYVYKDKLYMLITPMETSEKSDLSLYILDKSGEVEKKPLLKISTSLLLCLSMIQINFIIHQILGMVNLS